MNTEQREELVALAVEIILDAVRHEPWVPFHLKTIYHRIPPKWFTGVTDGEAVATREQIAIMQDAATRLADLCPSLAVELPSPDNDQLYAVFLSHSAGHEWLDVLRYVHGPGVPDVARVLSFSASELLTRVKSGELTRGFISELSVRHRLRCFGWNQIEKVIEELARKRGLELRVETKDDTSAKRTRRLQRFHVVSESETPPPLCPDAPNPVFRYQGARAGVHLAFSRFVQRQLLELKPQGTEQQPLWAFSSLREYWRCQPDCGETDGKYPIQLSGLLNGCVVHPDVTLSVDFGNHTYAWTAHCETKRPWSEVLPEIGRRLEERDVGEQYGLGAEAANLLRWVRNQPTDEFLLGCTPVVDEAIKDHELRLGAEWPAENLSSLLEVLCEEVTRKTPFVLKRVRWKSYSQEESRIHVSTNALTELSVIVQVQGWLQSLGVIKPQAEVAAALDSLRRSVS